jgi:hypothetical protein
MLVRALALFMAGRSKQAELARPRSEFSDDATLAQAAWLHEVRARRGVTVSVTREDW